VEKVIVHLHRQKPPNEQKAIIVPGLSSNKLPKNRLVLIAAAGTIY